MDFLKSIFTYDNNIVIEGLTNELNIFYVLEYYKQTKKNVIVLTSSLYEANKIYNSLKTYEENVFLFPMDDFLTSVAVAISPELKVKRLETLEELNKEPGIIITSLMGYLRFLPNVAIKERLEIQLKINCTINRDKLLKTLDDFGYNKESLVTTTGEYSVRGFIIDVYPIHSEHPIRIELFGDEIESLRYFDENTQKSIANIDNIIIKPYQEVITNEHSSLYEYANKPLVIYYDYSQIKASYIKIQNEILDYRIQEKVSDNTKYMFDLEEINPSYSIELCTFNDASANSKKIVRYKTAEIPCFNSNFDDLKDKYNLWLGQKRKVIFYLSRKEQANIIREILGENVRIVNKKINKGFIIDDYVVVSEFDIEKVEQKNVNYKNNYHIGRKLKDFDQISIGDYVVHAHHGIGIYRGIITLNKNGIKKDYIQIDYYGNDKIYIPVEKINTIFRYSGKDGLKPNINKLNSSSWQKTKRSIQSKIKDISEELIKLYAARKALKGIPYKTYAEEDVFASTFSYDETVDQLKAINEINNDLISSGPMDRLLCGDVGFGKTEVAFRAMFKTVLNNKQVMYLCPTTILSNQQYNSAVSRFKDYPIEIALLNRFTSKKETDRIVKSLKDGTIDIVFGTHRLLSSDIEFAKLGLLVIDEEQRFGVTHKEKIKKMKKDVNVLTLSATPIPRTLKMALSGLRDLSVIDSPPVNRYPVQTYVMEENDLIIKDAIYKELSRNGQIFILFNDIANIEEKKDYINKLVPDARIVCAHGQMNKNQIESIMQDFIEHKYDILLCTTIIETGIDIQNANTLIIYDADKFGLSQLYQIRGRVGRTNRIAYAYLLYAKNKILNEAAIKRLKAIKEFTELGSGYRIAMRDLSIRGAGDILGSEQAGFVDEVGISYYMSLIEEELKRQRGEQIVDDSDNYSLIDVETHISDKYVTEENIKIEIHQKINEVDSYAKLLEVKEELQDRFGKINESIEIYMYEEWFEKLAQKLGIERVNQNSRTIEVEIPETISNSLKMDTLFMEAYSINPNFGFKYLNKRIIISLTLANLDKHFLYYLVPLIEKIYHEIFPRK